MGTGWRRRALAAGALAMVVAGSAGACTEVPSAQDLQVAIINGGWGPGGPASVTWKVVGTAPVTGPTAVTLAVVSGPMVLTDALYYEPDQSYAATGYELAPDGRSMTLRFDGTMPVDKYHFFKFHYGNLTGPGVLRATVSNANDANPANDVAETAYEPGPPFVTTTTAP